MPKKANDNELNKTETLTKKSSNIKATSKAKKSTKAEVPTAKASTTKKSTVAKASATKSSTTKKTTTTKASATKTGTTKKTTTTKASTSKTSTTKKVATAKVPTTKASTTKVAKTKTSTSKTSATKKEPKVSTKKTSTSKKAVSSKVPSKKVVKDLTKDSIKSNEKDETIKQKSTISGEKFSIAEYYDLPYRYNQTIVKLLYQTPTTLFIYWDISDEDREKLKETYGEDFFEKTKPVLLVYNETKGYSFEVEINDFANCWYLNVNDSKCKYKIELGRKPFEVMYNGEVTEVKTTSKITQNYIPITSSNEVESPNDHILFEKKQEMIYFKNVKNNTVTAKNVANLSFVRSIGKVYKINDLYKKFYKDENLDQFGKEQNPSSSSLNSSGFKAF